MPTNAQLFEYETFFATFAFLLPGHPTLSTTFDYLKQRKKTAEKIDTNAQWFHCSWSILLKRVNIRVRGFHLPRMSNEKNPGGIGYIYISRGLY